MGEPIPQHENILRKSLKKASSLCNAYMYANVFLALSEEYQILAHMHARVLVVLRTGVPCAYTTCKKTVLGKGLVRRYLWLSYTTVMNGAQFSSLDETCELSVAGICSSCRNW